MGGGGNSRNGRSCGRWSDDIFDRIACGQRKRGSGRGNDEQSAGDASARTWTTKHGLKPPLQTGWTIERAREEQRPPRSGFCDRTAVARAVGSRRLVQHPGIARRFLIEAKSGVSDPGERVEPLEAEKDEGEEIDHKVARTMVGKLVLEHEPPLALLVYALEVTWQGNDRPEDSKSHRTWDFRRANEAD